MQIEIPPGCFPRQRVLRSELGHFGNETMKDIYGKVYRAVQCDVIVRRNIGVKRLTVVVNVIICFIKVAPESEGGDVLFSSFCIFAIVFNESA